MKFLRKPKKPTMAEVYKRVGKIEEALLARKKAEELISMQEKFENLEINKIEASEEKIRADVEHEMSSKVSYRDVTKATLGSFLGVIGGFSFYKGKEIAKTLTYTRSTLLFVVSLALLVVFMYFSGFRKMRGHKHLSLRIATIYITAMVVCVAALFLFGMLDISMSVHTLYSNVAVVSTIAVMGAATADLVGE